MRPEDDKKGFSYKDEKQLNKRIEKDFWDLVYNGSEQDFISYLRQLGYRKGSPEYSERIALWKECRMRKNLRRGR